MTEELKKGIFLKINDKLETLRLRLLLNKETIRMPNSIDPSLKEAVEFHRHITQQNKQANYVIQECEETIEKLHLLKNHFADLSLDVIVNLYNNYETFTMATFESKLLSKLNVRSTH